MEFKFLGKTPIWVNVYFYPHEFMVLTNLSLEVVDNRCKHIGLSYTFGYDDKSEELLNELRTYFQDARYITTRYTGKGRV